MFVWRYLDESGKDVGASARFEDAEAAESWLSEAWSDLRKRGVQEVELVDHDSGESVYRMGLSEAGA